MQATGIVRRIDNLGRLVIPKEIRKYLSLREGSPVEFFMEQEKVSIAKYNPLSQRQQTIKATCKVLEDKLNRPVWYFFDDVMMNTGRDEINRKFSPEFYRLIYSYRLVPFKDQQVYANDALTYSGFIVPVVMEGHHYGAYVVLGDDTQISEKDLEFVSFCADLIASRIHI